MFSTLTSDHNTQLLFLILCWLSHFIFSPLFFLRVLNCLGRTNLKINNLHKVVLTVQTCLLFLPVVAVDLLNNIIKTSHNFFLRHIVIQRLYSCFNGSCRNIEQIISSLLISASLIQPNRIKSHENRWIYVPFLCDCGCELWLCVPVHFNFRLIQLV